MTSNRPYLIRALYEWMVDNGVTPHVVVDASYADTTVPRQFVNEGKIVLNIAPSAVKNLGIGNDFVMFSARFSGQAMEVSFRPEAVLGIYARENGQGMLFSDEPEGEPPPSDGGESGDSRPGAKRPALKIVK